MGFKSNAGARSRIPSGMDMGVSVLTSGYWPTYPLVEVTLPQELEQCQQTFKYVCGGVCIHIHMGLYIHKYWFVYTHKYSLSHTHIHTHTHTPRDYYLSKHSGRRLVWYNGLGTCLVKAQFPKGAHELQVSLLQVCVCGYVDMCVGVGGWVCVDMCGCGWICVGVYMCV